MPKKPVASRAATGDTIARRRSTALASQTEARYRTLVEQIPAITFMASLDDGLDENEIYVSPHIETMLGFTQEEWLGDPFLWYRQLHPDDRQRWGAEFARTCAVGRAFQLRIPLHFARQSRGLGAWRSPRRARRARAPLFLQGIAFDITESKRAEQALRRSAEELERKVHERTAALEEASLRAELANQARASFLANMSHEIRTPLTASLASPICCAAGPTATRPSGWNGWKSSIAGGKHLLALINDILDLSKIDAGKLSVEDVDARRSRSSTKSARSCAPRPKRRACDLEAAFDGPIPQTIRTDPTRLRQMLMNIAGNAIKFTPPGTCRSPLACDRPAGDRPKLVIRNRRHGHRHSAGQAGIDLRSVHPGRFVDHAPVRRHRAWAWPSAAGWPNCSAAASR